MDTIYTFGRFRLDPSRRAILWGEEPVPLTPKAFDVLTLLIRNRGRVVTKEELLREAWPDATVDESSLSYQISILRKALSERSGGERHIATIPGQGYQWVAEATPVAGVRDELVLEERELTQITVEEEFEPARGRRNLIVLLALAGIAAIVTAASSFLSRPAATPAGEIRSLAILPFKPLTLAGKDEALEIGMADALISRMSRARDLTVRPLTAVRRFGGLEQDPVAAGRALEVDAVLDGTIHSADGRIRVSARVIRVADGKQIWSDQFDRESGDLFAIHDSVGVQLASALAQSLKGDDRARIATHETQSIEAWREFALARLRSSRPGGGNLREAIGHLERAIALDPQYAAAHAELANCYAILPVGADGDPRQSSRLARESADRALALDPRLADAYVARGTALFWFEWDWKGAEEDFLEAIRLEPNDALAHLRYAHLLSNAGRAVEAERHARRAERLDPLSIMAITLSGQFMLQRGDLDGALRQLDHALELDPDFWIAHLNRGKALELQGRHDEAVREFEKAMAGSGENNEPLSMIGHLHAIRGETAEARAVLAQMSALASRRYVPPTKLALVHAGLGETEAAITLLERACEARDVGMLFLDVNPRWRPLHGDPRWRSLRRCAGLE